MKVKIFTNYFANELEDAVNRFLSAHKKIKITHIVQSESLGIEDQDGSHSFEKKNITISIFYTEK